MLSDASLLNGRVTLDYAAYQAHTRKVKRTRGRRTGVEARWSEFASALGQPSGFDEARDYAGAACQCSLDHDLPAAKQPWSELVR